MTPFSPSYDNKIPKRYSVGTLEQKVDNKLALQRKLHWVEDKETPLICLPSSASQHQGGELLKLLLPGLLTQSLQIVVLGRGSREFGELLTALSREKSHKLAILPDDETHQRLMYAGSDMALFTAIPNKDESLEHCLQYGCVPVAPKTSPLKDYNPIQETGNSFVYEPLSEWHAFAAVMRALETFKFPYDWKTIAKHAMESVEEAKED